MKIFINILITFLYWSVIFVLLKKLKIFNIIKYIMLFSSFIGYIVMYYYLFDGSFNLYNYLIIIFTFIYIFIYK